MKNLFKVNLVLFFFLFISLQNLLCQNKIESLRQISENNGSDLIKSLSHYRIASLFDSSPLKGKEVTLNLNIDTLELYWKALRKVVNYIPKSYDDEREVNYFLPQFLTDIIKDYGDQEYDKLTNLYKSLPDTSYLRGESFLVPFFQYQVYKEIKSILEEKISPTKYLIEPTNTTIKNDYGKETEYLNKCKELFSSVKQHYQQRVLNDTICGWYSIQSNQNLFYKNIENILFKRSMDDFKNLYRFRWGSWCGTGSEYFYSKQLLVELLILLRERDYLSILGRNDYYSGPKLSGKTKIKLFELCNIDWIDFYTGSILSGELNSVPTIFTKSGSSKAALNLFEVKDSIPSKGWYIIKCAEFINPISEEEREYFDYFDDNQFLKTYENNLPLQTLLVNDELKKKLKQEVINISATADDFYLCQSAIDALVKIKFDDEVKETLILLTKSKFSIIRGNAANILKKKGIVISLPKDDGKIKYKFLVDGNPLKKDRIRWELYNDIKPDRSFLNSSEITNDDGILSIARDLLLDRIDEIKKIVFYPDVMNSGGNQVIFIYDSQMPRDLTDTTVIDISTVKASIRFHLNRNAEFYKEKKMRINAFPPKVIMLSYEPEIKELFNFPVRFQKNLKCSFSAYVPGAITWFSPNRDTLKDNLIFDVYLENGTNVTFSLELPVGKDADKWEMFDLEKIGSSRWDNNFHYDYSIGGYENVPVGEYRLVISSSSEKKSKQNRNDNECKEQILQEYPDYEGKIVSFTITKNSPASIDLGIIKLDAVKEK